ncbi:3'(2'),5'-bisphosphate nucleotidase CysQ [Umezawaea sp. NPDC059074]|uniref:3'(2'),5'-bisphosphate nucleotidase CysQ n=1 Tax=Umezawaea sp. NPDC059074 TaxID=3346716 RepID=UPI0036916CBF
MSLGDEGLSVVLAGESGRLLEELRRGALSGAELGRAGDLLSHRFLVRALADARPEDAVLSEESADDPRRLDEDRVWIVDPLDGSHEYGMPGRTDWAVHVALWERGRGITAAAVAQPALNLVCANGDVVASRRAGERLRILVSGSRPPVFADAVASSLGAEIVPMGSAGAKTVAVVRGEADAYLHGGGQWEWDSAAPAGVALAAGLHASRVDGTPLEYNQAHPYLPDLLICAPEHSEPILAAVREAGA